MRLVLAVLFLLHSSIVFAQDSAPSPTMIHSACVGALASDEFGQHCYHETIAPCLDWNLFPSRATRGNCLNHVQNTWSNFLQVQFEKAQERALEYENDVAGHHYVGFRQAVVAAQEAWRRFVDLDCKATTYYYPNKARHIMCDIAHIAERGLLLRLRNHAGGR